MKCPIDDYQLKVKTIEGVEVEHCEKCSGMFLRKGELNKITHETAGDVEFASFEHIDPSRTTGYMCPLCINERMVEVNFISFSNIVMKYCPKCDGIWLDKGELDAINREIDKLNSEDREHWEHSFRVFLSKLPF